MTFACDTHVRQRASRCACAGWLMAGGDLRPASVRVRQVTASPLAAERGGSSPGTSTRWPGPETLGRSARLVGAFDIRSVRRVQGGLWQGTSSSCQPGQCPALQ